MSYLTRCWARLPPRSADRTRQLYAQNKAVNICVVCGISIKETHRYHYVERGSQHWDCARPGTVDPILRAKVVAENVKRRSVLVYGTFRKDSLTPITFGATREQAIERYEEEYGEPWAEKSRSPVRLCRRYLS